MSAATTMQGMKQKSGIWELKVKAKFMEVTNTNKQDNVEGVNHFNH